MSRTAATFAPPVVEARRWLAEAQLPEGVDLINVSQAAPIDPPPLALRQAMADIALNEPQAHLYGPVLGLPALRDEIARNCTALYQGAIAPEQVAVTAGCNEAFCATIASLLDEGDEVILPVPWYFNHKMALDMAGAVSVPLEVGPDMVPDPAEAEALITDRTRAIVLVTPNNPVGVEYPPQVIAGFMDLTAASGIKLIVDETYRDFHSATGAPHDLIARPNWDKHLIQLYSFSKAYRLTGHRVGAIMAAPDRLLETTSVLALPPQVLNWIIASGLELPGRG